MSLSEIDDHDDIDALGLEGLGREPEDDVFFKPVRRDERDTLGIFSLEKAQGLFGGVDLRGPDADQGPAGEVLRRIDFLGLMPPGADKDSAAMTSSGISLDMGFDILGLLIEPDGRLDSIHYPAS